MRPTARPETHQNLIHPDKDHGASPRRGRANHGHLTHEAAEFAFFSATTPGQHNAAHPNQNAAKDCLTLRGDFCSHLLCICFAAAFALRANRKNGDDRVRTDDPLLAKQVLSQLSYAPQSRWWAREDLNLRPHAYQACALTS
jgi:hypothetical protein